MKCLKALNPVLLLLFLGVSGVNAAPVAINSLFVESTTVTLDLFGTALPPSPVTATGSFLPPVEITMGAYQNVANPIFSISQNGLNLSVYSTGTAGVPPPPSGSVDGSTISVDFSSLRALVTYSTYSFDVALWPLTTQLDYGYYDPLTGDYTVGWSENFRLLLNNNNTLDISLSGYLTTVPVPVPAAVWLFGSGLLGLAGVVRRRKA